MQAGAERRLFFSPSVIISPMETLGLDTPFDAPVYRLESCPSTMMVLRELSDHGSPHGTALITDEQTAGRGRVAGRRWEGGPGAENLAMSLLWIADGALPQALPLRAGLAVIKALDFLYPALGRRLALKWPNDILVDVHDLEDSFPRRAGDPFPGWRKVCGILCEGSFDRVFIGIGVNINTRSFTPELAQKASSLYLINAALPGDSQFQDAELAAQGETAECHVKERNRLAQAILGTLYKCLGPGYPWKRECEERLWRRGQEVSLERGMALSGCSLRAVIEGLSSDGALRVSREGKEEIIPCGELTGSS